ncbi:MAG: acyltransferase family protein [Janthinobacterium lividum]
MTDTAPTPSRNLSSLQAGRAFAAILVVLFHDSESIFVLPKYWGDKPFGRLFDFGDSRVFFFFVLSGYIIFYAHCSDLDCPGRLASYAWKRFRRIYPIYWIVLLATLPAYFLISGFGFGFEKQPSVIVASFLLVHFDTTNAVMTVSWTLFHEILFYALFALAIWRRRLGLTILGAWFMLSFVSMATDHRSMLTGFYFSNVHLLFGLGIAACWWVQRRSVPFPAAIVLLGATIFLLAGADEIHRDHAASDWRTLAFGCGSMLAMVGMVALEGSARLRVPAWLRLLGDASYSIYLVHFPVLSLLAKLAWASGAARLLPVPAAYILLAGLAVSAGVLCHLWIERPLLGLLGQKSGGAQRFRLGAISP